VHFAHFRKKLLKQRRFRQALGIAIILSIAIGVTIVPLERNHPGASIRTTSDGLWWSVQTLTTVGYGDVVPVSDVGRLLGAAMQILGAVLFGVLIAMVGSSMNRSQEEFYWNRLFQRLDEMEKKISYLEKSQNILVADAFDPNNSSNVGSDSNSAPPDQK